MKNGTILAGHTGVASEGGILAELNAKVIPPRPNTGSLGTIVAACMAGLALPSIIVADLFTNKVAAFTSLSKAAIAAALSAGKGEEDILSFIPTTDTRASSSWTIRDATDAELVSDLVPPAITSPLAVALDKVFGPGPSTKTLAALTDSVDTALSTAEVQEGGYLVIDQIDKTVTLYVGGAAVDGIASGAVSLSGHIATFVLEATAASAAGVGLFQL